MSHVESVDVTVTDLDAVKAACKRLGVDFIQGKKTYNWFGQHVGDYPLPKGMTEEELGKCDHVVKVPGVNYEIGLVKKKDGKGYTLAYDFWGSSKNGGHDGGQLKARFGDKLQKFVDAYSVEALKRQALKKGYMCSEKVLPSGAIQLKVTGF